MTNNTELLHFPCNFPIKVFGFANEQFEQTVLSIFHQHVSDLGEAAIRSRLSKDGKYLALTVTIQAQSKEQIDAIYQALTDHELVIMAL